MIETVVKRMQGKMKEEGREEGRKEGRKEGREEGKEEVTIDMARNLKAMGMSIPDIVKVTGLPYEVIEKL